VWNTSGIKTRDQLGNTIAACTYNCLCLQGELQQGTRRTLRPLALIFCSPVWLLAAWCESRNDFCNFRLDRLQTVEFCDACFADESDKNLSAYKAQDAIC